MPPDEREIGTLDESLISFRLSGPNGRLSQFDQSEEESASSGDSAVLSPRRKPRRRLTRKEYWKKKMRIIARIETSRIHVTPTSRRAMTAEKDSKSANEKLHRSTHQRNPNVRFAYTEYMAQPYAYMTRVAEVREPDSYAEAAKHTNWRKMKHGTWLTHPRV